MKAIVASTPIILFLAARSSGKSELGARWCLKKCLENPGTIGAIIAPIYQQSLTCVKKFQLLLDSLKIKNVFNRNPTFKKTQLPDHKNVLSIDIPGSDYATHIYIFSAENYDGIRGKEFQFCHLDELRDFKKEAYETILPCLRGFGNDAYQQLLTTTSNGKDWMYDSFINSERKDITIVRSKTEENIFNPPNFINLLKDQLSERMFRQEVLNDILDSDLNAMLYAFSDANLKPAVLGGQMWVTMDQNVQPLTALIISKVGTISHVVDDIVITEANLTSLINGIKNKIGDTKVVYMAGDRSGNNRTWTGADTFYNQLRSGLVKVGINAIDKTNKSNPKKFPSVELVNRELERQKLFVDPKCKTLIEHINKARWKSDKYEMDKPFFDAHLVDCLTYYISTICRPLEITGLNVSYM